jgi:hypothetical protein
VLLPGAPPAGPLVPAVVWQAERLIATPWRRAGEEVLAAVDDLLTGFLQAYRQARRP